MLAQSQTLPSLGDILRTGLVDLPDAQRVALADVPTLTEAAQRLIHRLWGRPSWATDHSPHLGGQLVAFRFNGLACKETGPADLSNTIAPGPHLFAALAVMMFDNAEWKAKPLSGPDAPERESIPFRENFYARFAMLRLLMDRLTIASSVDVLGDSRNAGTERLAIRQAAVQSWWNARMSEGYDRSSTLFVLRLVADRQVMAAIEWLPSGDPGPHQAPSA